MPEFVSLPGQEHYVAPLDETVVTDVGAVDTSGSPESRWKQSWKQLRSNWIFWVSLVMLVIVLLMVVAPGMFTSVDPTYADLGKSLDGPSAGHIAGFNQQGYDVFARTVYGARASVLVGFLTTAVVTVVGLLVGAVAGFYGKFTDTVLSRFADIFFAIPLLLGAIVSLSIFNNLMPHRNEFVAIIAVVLAQALFSWPQVTRIARGAIMELKSLEFVDASRAIGSSSSSTLVRHVIPNSLAPVIVIATVSLGIFIVTEATLSFLGIGLPFNVVSWGNDISAAQVQVRSGQHLGVLFWPAGALAFTVLAFILLGDAVQDALDPKARD